MDQSTADAGATGEVSSLQRQALGNLQFIRRTMESAGFFTAVPGSAGVTMGAIGLLAAGLAAIPALAPHWLLVWLLAGGAAFAAGASLIAYKARTTGVTLYSGPARRFVLCLSPALAAGAILTVVFATRGDTTLLPGCWLLLYGCGVAGASAVSLPVILAMGICFMVLGVVAFMAPPGLANLLLGAGFGGLHLVFGLLLARGHDG